jgi:electron transfer flavoprotein beta subunit
MLNLVVCIKQVPMAAELPWDPKTGTLKRENAEGMMNPSCKQALEAALELREKHGGTITAMTMGPEMAIEVLHEARAMGADQGILLSDRLMAGADTFITSQTLGKAIEKYCPDFDLVLCGSLTSDSETGQVGPQLAEDLDIPGIAYIHGMELHGKTLRVMRVADHFLETLEMDLPGLVTVTSRASNPGYARLAGLQQTFERNGLVKVTAKDLGLTPGESGIQGSPTKILEVYAPGSENAGVVLTGSTKKILEALFNQFDDVMGSAMGKDLKMEDTDGE